MKYEKDLMVSWDEYAIKKTIEHYRQAALQEGTSEVPIQHNPSSRFAASGHRGAGVTSSGADYYFYMR